MVVLEVKYILDSCAYWERVVQLGELWEQDEHDVTVGVMQYTFSAEQQERMMMSSAAKQTPMNGGPWTIMYNDWRIERENCDKTMVKVWA